jgi:NAD-dependent dihydropyrimidine dehydrogenase PreA subunit
MKRQIIKIDEDLCNGCGDCIVGCSEGALQLIDGKAKLVKENFCDGFGDCVGTCPTGALTIEERETVAFDEVATKQHLLNTQGVEAVWRMEEAQKKHQSPDDIPTSHQGCPGSQMREIKRTEEKPAVDSNIGGQAIPSELAQWPVQIHLVPPTAPYFKNKELVVMSTCGPIASADVHWRYLRGRSVVVGCPKLDNTEPYVSKLAEILKENTIPKVIVARMEVPCCGGLSMIVKQAVEMSGRTDLVVQEDVIGVDGSMKGVQNI